jgi:hypothetical protein
MKKYAFIVVLAFSMIMTPVMATAQTGAPSSGMIELQDGTKISVEGDMVYVVAADGTKTSAPDGEHVTKDGNTIVTQDGKIAR